MTFARFQDRTEAGRLLAGKLKAYANRPDVVVLALPRGGVPVGYEVAMALHAPLDVFVVRKLGVPGQEELAMGAIASGGVRVLNRPIVEALEITESQIESVAAAEQQVLERRGLRYRGGRWCYSLTATDSTHGHLLLTGHAELAHYENVRRRLQGTCNFVAHGHTGPRQRQD